MGRAILSRSNEPELRAVSTKPTTLTPCAIDRSPTERLVRQNEKGAGTSWLMYPPRFNPLAPWRQSGRFKGPILSFARPGEKYAAPATI